MTQSSESVETYQARVEAACAAMRDGRLDESDGAFAALCDQYPKLPAAFRWRAELAQRRRDWAMALSCWDGALQACGAKAPYNWHLSRGWALMHLGRPAEAETVFAALCADAPEDSRALASLAQSLWRQHRWEDAIVQWDALLDRFTDNSPPDWRDARAQCLLKAGRLERAAEAYQDLLDHQPDNPAAHHALIWLLVRLARRADAAQASARALARCPTNPDLLTQAARIAITHADGKIIAAQDYVAARTYLRSALDAADTLRHYERIFMEVPIAFDGIDRTSIWLELDSRVGKLTEDRSAAVANQARILAARVKLALRDHDGFLQLADQITDNENSPLARRLRGTARLLRAPRFPNFEAEKVFGIGIGKTGTTSLMEALDILGYDGSHYVNELTREILTLDDAFMFDALGDTPICLMFESLYFLFPRAKFIHTLRAAGWFQSLEAHAGRHKRAVRATLERAGDADAGSTARQAFYDIRPLLTHAGLYGTLTGQAAYHSYNDRVRTFFNDNDSARLLEFDMFAGDDWTKLCAFLHRPIPATPFPWKNKAPARDAAP